MQLDSPSRLDWNFARHHGPARFRRKDLYKSPRLHTRYLSAERLGRVDGSALVHFHCHHHAVIKSNAEQAILDRLGLDYEVLKSGCCGMAGAFGFETAKYDVSLAIGERVLLPRVRQAPADTAILANGFSCREQIEQSTGRSTVHIAELLNQSMSSSL